MMTLLSIPCFSKVPSLLQLSESFPEVLSAINTHSDVAARVQHGDTQEQSAETDWVLLAEKLNEQADAVVPRSKIKG
jgi:uncharacterized membrane protein YccC